VDDYTPGKFLYTNCSDLNSTLKCQDTYNYGRCFNLTNLNGTLASCDQNRTDLNQIGFWKTQFPSQDFWTYYYYYYNYYKESIRMNNF
jgi:hypothetical protein